MPAGRWEGRKWLRTMVGGACMGVAEIIPGISGGTVAFILGFYQELIDSIKTLNFSALKLLLSLKVREFFRSIAWRFLLPLVFGMVGSLLSLARLMSALLEHEQCRCYLFAVFMGLIVASALYCARQVQRWCPKNIVALLVCVGLSYFVTSMVKTDEETTATSFDVHLPREHVLERGRYQVIDNYDAEKEMLRGVSVATLSAMIAKQVVTPDTSVYSYAAQRYGLARDFADGHFHRNIDGWLVGCGAVGVSAMLLPGISGSYLFVALGVYPVIVGALADFVEGLWQWSLNGEACFILLSVLIGIGLGGLLFVQVISWLFRRHTDMATAMLTGFMVGSLRCVWPFWSYHYYLEPLQLHKGPRLHIEHPILPDIGSTVFWSACILMLIGFMIVIVFETFSSKEHHNRQL